MQNYQYVGDSDDDDGGDDDFLCKGVECFGEGYSPDHTPSIPVNEYWSHNIGILFLSLPSHSEETLAVCLWSFSGLPGVQDRPPY